MEDIPAPGRKSILSDVIGLAATLGITRRPPIGHLRIVGDLLEIGTLIWQDGRVDEIPRIGIDAAADSELRHASEAAMMYGPVGKGWESHPEIGWRAAVCVALHDSSARHLRAAASTSSLVPGSSRSR